MGSEPTYPARIACVAIGMPSVCFAKKEKKSRIIVSASFLVFGFSFDSLLKQFRRMCHDETQKGLIGGKAKGVWELTARTRGATIIKGYGTFG